MSDEHKGKRNPPPKIVDGKYPCPCCGKDGLKLIESMINVWRTCDVVVALDGSNSVSWGSMDRIYDSCKNEYIECQECWQVFDIPDDAEDLFEYD